MKYFYFVTAFFFLPVSHLWGQTAKVLSQFEVFQNGDQVNLVWTMNAGNTCLGIDIERSVEGGPFERIGIINGICGSPVASVSYAYIDEQPVAHTYMNYRLNMGTLGFSEEEEIRFVDDSKQSVVISPNPNNGYMVLNFPQPIPSGSVLEVYHPDGRLLDTIKLSEGRKIGVYHGGEEHGLLILAVKNASGRILASGKFVYQK